MHRRCSVPIALLGALFATATAATAQNISIPLFVGEVGGGANVTLGSWGSGKAEPSQDNVLIGARSIKATTQGLYQGALLDFKTPVDLASAFANPNAYIRLQLRFTGTGSTQQIYDPLSTETRRANASPFERMRFLLTMADGTRYELVRPINIRGSEDPNGYVPVAFPVAALRKGRGGETRPVPTGEGAKLSQIAIFGDKYQQFFIGEIRVITDDTEITVTPLDEQIAFVNDLLTFTGSAEGGASTLKYSWDFNAQDGIQEDRTGETVQYYWRKPGTYTVTLTVSDVDGLKKPATSTVTVDVAE